MKISILIPCHNEEKSVAACVRSCLAQTRKVDQIVVVNDGSTDTSPQILKGFGRKIKVINVYPATGNKSYAQEIGIKSITGDVCIFTDGDTLLDNNFAELIEKDFTNKDVAAVGGYVKSIRYNWLTACRAYDYSIGQNIHKQAQSSLNFTMVIPGAACAIRMSVLRNNLQFAHDTLTEDMDLTYQLNKLGFRIVFNRKAIAYTQDPSTIYSYVNQMRRWYGGGWQNLIKHLDSDLIKDPRRVMELSLMYLEGLVFSSLLFLLPIINLKLSFLFYGFYFSLLCLEAVYASIYEKRRDLLLVPPFYFVVTHINSAIFIEQFFKEAILRKSNLVWFHPERVRL